MCVSACIKKERSIAYRRRYGGTGRASGSQIPEQNGCPCYTVVCAVAMLLFCEDFFFFYLLFKNPDESRRVTFLAAQSASMQCHGNGVLEAAKYRLVGFGMGGRGRKDYPWGVGSRWFGKLMPDFLLESVISFIIRLLHLCCGVAAHTCVSFSGYISQREDSESCIHVSLTMSGLLEAQLLCVCISPIRSFCVST